MSTSTEESNDTYEPTTIEERLELYKHQLWLERVGIEHLNEMAIVERKEYLEGRLEYAKQIHAERLQFERNFKDYGQLALRTMFLLNAGSLVFLLAFIGSTLGKSVGNLALTPAMFKLSFIYFVGGVVSVACALIFAYWNYHTQFWMLAQAPQLANNIMQGTKEWPRAYTKWKHRIVDATWLLSTIAGIASGALFLIGCWEVLSVFESLK